MDDWYVGEKVTIEWTSDESIPSNATLKVYLDTVDGIKYLIGTTPNTGSFSWVVTSQCVGMDVYPDLEYAGGGYDENLVPIEISTAPLPTTTLYNGPISINITSPQNGAILHPGDTVNITWTTVNLPLTLICGLISLVVVLRYYLAASPIQVALHGSFHPTSLPHKYTLALI